MRPRIVLALAAVIASGAAGALAAAPAHADANPAAGFGTPTMVDPFRVGYEPDLAIDVSKAGGPYQGSTFTSVPNGFSTTQSYIWRSDDNRQTFHLAEGNALGKSTTCVGGGDSEMKVDPVNGDIYFADLQGLTNFSNSVSTDGGHTWDTSCNAVNGTDVDRQWEGIDDNGGTAAVGPGANDGRMYFDYDNVDQNVPAEVTTGASGGNQLVMNESADGVHFGADCTGADTGNGNFQAAGCPEPATPISNNEGIPGNIVVDNVAGSPFEHRVYAIHTGGSGTDVIVSWCSGKAGDDTAATVANDCTDPTQINTGDVAHVNVNWHDAVVREADVPTGKLFPSIAMDTAGNLYAVWAEVPSNAPAAIKMATSTDGGQTWSAPIVVSPPSQQDTVMPWVVAGDPGRVGVAWYGTSDGLDPTTNAWGPDSDNSADWNLYYAASTDALDADRSFAVSQVNEPGHPVKFGNISTGGLTGSDDRSLGDFFQVQAGPEGQAVISYVDDTSANRNQDTCQGCGETPPEAAGPVMVATQNAGPDLFTAKSVPGGGTHLDSISVDAAQAAKDAYYGALGQDVPAAANQQLLGASVTQADPTHLKVTLTTADPNLASDLTVSPTMGGPVANWMVRWAAPSYQAPGDGNIFYVGMESDAGQAPTFYTGSSQSITTTHAKYFEYPQTTAVTGAISGSSISWTVPLSAIGSPATGQGLYTVTGFTDTQLQPSPTSTTTVPQNGGEAGDENIPNLISATPPFDYTVGDNVGADLPESALPAGMAALALIVVTGMALRRRRTARGVIGR